MTAVSLNLPFNSVVVTTKPLQDIREVIYSHIKKVDLFVPALMGHLLGRDLKDLTEESNSKSRSIAKVEVGFKVVIRIEHSREVQEGACTTKGEQISSDCTETLNRVRERFLLSLKTDPEINATVLNGMRDEIQEFHQAHQEKDETEEYRLLYKLLIEEDSSSGSQLLGLAERTLSPEEAQRVLTAKIHQHPTIVNAMTNHVMTGGKSQFCQQFVTGVMNSHTQDIKSSRDRAKDLEHLFKKAIESLANQISKGFNMGRLKSNYPVEVALKEMRFGVTVDDESILTSTKLTFPLNA
jgi:hypothetical protein